MLLNSETLIKDFLKVAELAEVYLPEGAISVDKLPAPHKPPSVLPKGKMAIYVFSWRGQCLKVGKVGPKSQARYTSQHYNMESSKSNLAKSLFLARVEIGLSNVSETNMGAWIKENVDRMNFFLDSGYGIRVLTLFESFLQCRLKPKFEGFESQR